MALDGGDGAVDVGHCLTLCDATDQNLAVLGECDDGGGGAGALCVSDDDRVATFQCCYDRVGGTEVNTYCTCHMFIHSLGVSAPLLLMRGGISLRVVEAVGAALAAPCGVACAAP